MVAVYRVLPIRLFHVNNGHSIRLRAATVLPSRSFDLVTNASGAVLPRWTDPANYQGPNGASMRPNTSTLQTVARSFQGSDVIVWDIPRGTKLPEDLVLVHESRDHFSLQAAREMTVHRLNQRITAFLNEHGVQRSRSDWVRQYPRATEDMDKTPFSQAETNSSSSAAASSSKRRAATNTAGDEWDETNQRWLRYDHNAQAWTFWTHKSNRSSAVSNRGSADRQPMGQDQIDCVWRLTPIPEASDL